MSARFIPEDESLSIPESSIDTVYHGAILKKVREAFP